LLKGQRPWRLLSAAEKCSSNCCLQVLPLLLLLLLLLLALPLLFSWLSLAWQQRETPAPHPPSLVRLQLLLLHWCPQELAAAAAP
jgi:hypothetical protein